MDRKLKVKRIILIILSVLCVTFIFTQSALPAGKSSEKSGFVLDFLNGITEFLGLGSVFNGHIVRKLAHFFEFAVLSGLVYSTYKLFLNMVYKTCCATVITYTSVAAVDEFIQLFSDGRACQLTDVLLDSAGGTFALIIMLSISFISKACENKEKV